MTYTSARRPDHPAAPSAQPSAEPSRSRRGGPRIFALLSLIGLLAPVTSACEKEPALLAHEQLGFHEELSIGTPITTILEVCGTPRCTLRDSAIFSEIEYVSDSATLIRGVILRTKAPDPPSVLESQEVFKRTRQTLQLTLGEGQTFLKSADPTYWPKRDVMARVVTLTTDDKQRTVLSVGAVGPDAEKIPEFGDARDQIKVYDYWKKITAASLGETKTKSPSP